MLLYFDDTKGVDYAIYVGSAGEGWHVVNVDNCTVTCPPDFVGRSSRIDKLLYNRVVFDESK